MADKLLALREDMENRRVQQEKRDEAERVKKEKAEAAAKGEKDDLDDILNSVLHAAENFEQRTEAEKIAKSSPVPSHPVVDRNGHGDTTTPATPAAVAVVDKEQLEKTAEKVKLKKSIAVSVHPTHTLRVKKFISARATSNIFRFSFGKKRLSRCGGLIAAARGFNYISKSHKSRDVWPYPAPKPLFHIWWKYRLSQCADVFTLAHLFSTFVRLLKWDLVNERPAFVDGDKLVWTEKSDEEHSHFEIKSRRFIPGSGQLRLEYEMKQEIVPIESDEVIPTRDSRAVEAMARSGRRLRPLKPTADDIHPRSEHRESLTWVGEEKMKIWQIDLYHRVTEDGGVNINRSNYSNLTKPSDTRHNLRDRNSLRPPPKIAQPDDDYKPERDLGYTRTGSSSSRVTEYDPSGRGTNMNEKQTWKTHFLQPKNVPPSPAANQQPRTTSINRIMQKPDGTLVSISDSKNFAPYRTVTPVPRPIQSPGPRAAVGPRPGPQPNATNVRITKQVLESILGNPNQFTQINHDQPPENCNYLKVRAIDLISTQKR